VAACNPDLRQIFIFDISDFSRPLTTLPQFDSTVQYPAPSDWSPDGRQIAIDGVGGSGAGVWVYSLETRTYRRLADGSDPAWLADGRRLVYDNRGRLRVVDTITGNTKEVLAIPGETLAWPVPIAGDSQLLFKRTSFSSDIWTVRFGEK
jgi:Tol biopolymer transport system component